MSPDRWQRVEELYHSALERDSEGRASYLATACGGDEELRREVESLLESENVPRRMLDGTALETAGAWPDATKLEAGNELGPYRIEGLLGEGGMGVVYRATDTRLGRTVAVKVLQPGFAADTQARERFRREARAISALSHPRICALHDVGEHEGIHYLVMEFVAGQTLAERLKKGPLPLEHVLRYGGQIADALAAAHARGIVHRDLKPGNVILTSAGVKLLDFGLAKLAASPATGQKETLTAERIVMGTPNYMSPEQMEGGECDERSDIFSLGLVLYEMAVGNRPDTAVGREIEPPRLHQIVRGCLSKDAAERWHSATDIRLMLETVTFSQGTRLPNSGSRSLWMTVAVVAIVAVFAAGWLLRGRVASNDGEIGATHLLVGLPESAVPAPPVRPYPRVAMSPDGRRLAMVVVERDNQRSIWTRDLDSPAIRLVYQSDQSDDPLFPFWSPDSEWIAFVTRSHLMRARYSGGSLQNICPSTFEGPGSWGFDGTILLTSKSGGVVSLPAQGGTPVEITTPDPSLGELSHNYPVFLPDGKRFLYLSKNRHPEKDAIWVQELRTVQRKLLMQNSTAAVAISTGYLLFVRGRTLFAQRLNMSRLELEGRPLAVAEGVATYQADSFPRISGFASFSVSARGVLAYGSRNPVPLSELVWFNRSGKRLGTVGQPGRISKIALSPDDRRVAVELIAGGRRDIGLLDLETGAFPLLPRQPGVSHVDPVWSPDSRRVAIAAVTRERGEIREINISSMASTILYSDDAKAKFLDDWSRDGRFIAYHGDTDNLALPLFGERKPIVLEKGVGRVAAWDQVTFSPDGRWIAFYPVSGRPEITVASFPSLSERRQVSVEGGFQPQWSKDGKEVFFISSKGTLMSAPIRRGAGSTLESGVPRSMFDLGLFSTIWTQYQVSADGQRFLAIQPVKSDQADPIHVILNWPALLRR